MFLPLETTDDLCRLLVTKASLEGPPEFDMNGQRFILLSAEREDGSGHNFNIRAYDRQNVVRTMFVRLRD